MTNEKQPIQAGDKVIYTPFTDDQKITVPTEATVESVNADGTVNLKFENRETRSNINVEIGFNGCIPRTDSGEQDPPAGDPDPTGDVDPNAPVEEKKTDGGESGDVNGAENSDNNQALAGDAPVTGE